MTDIVVLDRLYPAYDSDWYRLLGSTEAPASSRKRLSPSQAILDACGTSDDVTNSVHYGHLAKAVSSLVGEEARSGVHYIGREVVNLPKQILLASGFSVEATTPKVVAGEVDTSVASRAEETTGDPVGFPTTILRVEDLILPVLKYWHYPTGTPCSPACHRQYQ
ncbi:hypothetical protein SCLCIDRAFT_20656 [Scleroderma citrinum Foug A]|uniref:Uncharacterized protein n=1 Tax=Scleroderma citrinum Foug A TaxID=1036808 RepID=A0A0C3E661_9AGAM|nr:hypothetical protein SCLCIDRAFT_20656 [Scleroderma citrinum Foug A]